MKKLIIMLMVAVNATAFTVACTNPQTEEDYEIQIIDKNEAESPRDTKTKKEGTN